jgi:hypothetical protein
MERKAYLLLQIIQVEDTNCSARIVKEQTPFWVFGGVGYGETGRAHIRKFS